MSSNISHGVDMEEPPQIYYVEDVEGSDFTFYLSREGNLVLMDGPPKRNVEGDPKGPSIVTQAFSNSVPIRLVKLPPLLVADDVVCSAEELRDRLNEALTASPQNAATKLAEKIGLEVCVVPWEPGTFLKALLKAINKVLKEDNDELLVEDRWNSAWEPHEQQVVEQLSDVSRRICKNRKKIERIFSGAFKSFRFSDSVVHGRALVCSSYRGNFLSVSFREKNETLSFEPNVDAGEWPLSMSDYCLELYNVIKQAGEHGLLLVAGSTNTAKSEIASGLIFNHLKTEVEKKRKRRPHLVTFEDPIEKFYVPLSIEEIVAESAKRKVATHSVRMPALNGNIDYTPREKAKDYEDGSDDDDALQKALEDALRQTPSVFFVGETRKRKHWRRIIDFAGTGHLIVTTTHAESLTEAMRKLFEALEVTTPSQRNEIASRLLGIIHLRPDLKTKVVLPALWRRTTMGKNTLTAEGLSSLLPHRPIGSNIDPESSACDEGCLGRSWFVERLLRKARPGTISTDEAAELTKLATNWDLEGV